MAAYIGYIGTKLEHIQPKLSSDQLVVNYNTLNKQGKCGTNYISSKQDKKLKKTLEM